MRLLVANNVSNIQKFNSVSVYMIIHIKYKKISKIKKKHSNLKFQTVRILK
jgi:hypothetical protein